MDQKKHMVLEDITAKCAPCQRIRAASPRFLVTMGYENSKFNSKVNVDVLEVDSHKILHIVDDATRFSGDCIFTRQTTLEV